MWVEEFENLSIFSEENIKTWIVTYVYFNNDISSVISQARGELIDIKKELFEMRIK